MICIIWYDYKQAYKVFRNSHLKYKSYITFSWIKLFKVKQGLTPSKIVPSNNYIVMICIYVKNIRCKMIIGRRSLNFFWTDKYKCIGSWAMKILSTYILYWFNNTNANGVCVMYAWPLNLDNNISGLSTRPCDLTTQIWVEATEKKRSALACVYVVRDSSAVRRLFVWLVGAMERQSTLHKENSGFAAPTLGQSISTFRGYQILFSIGNPYINHFTNHFSIHS